MPRGEKSSEKAKVKFRFIEFELEGGNSAVENSVRNLVAALGKSAQPAIGAQASGANSVLPEVGALKNVESQNREEVEHSEEQPSEARSKKQYLPNPKLLDGIDFTTSPSLEEYLAKADVGDATSKRYLGIAGWFKQARQLEEVSIDHIFTAFRHLGWHTGKDVSKPLRQMKNQNQWFKAGTKPGFYAITFIGEDAIAKMGNANSQ